MANFDTLQVRKISRARGIYAGKEQSVTGNLIVRDGDSIATTDLIRAVIVGENVRPVRVILQSTPLSGTPVLTNPTFNVGVSPVVITAGFERPNGDAYDALAADADILSAALVLSTDNMKQDVEVARPVADAVSKYGPYYVTATPAGVGAFSVAGGDIQLSLTIVFLGEESTVTPIYEEFVNQKVSND